MRWEGAEGEGDEVGGDRGRGFAGDMGGRGKGEGRGGQG